MRATLHLVAGPVLALLVAWALGVAGPLPTALAALAGQAASLPVVARLERRRFFRELLPMRRRRGDPRVSHSVVRGRPTASDVAVMVGLHVAAALLAAAAFLLVLR
jgi:hypothetical protein